jgi:hypothetical protein
LTYHQEEEKGLDKPLQVMKPQEEESNKEIAVRQESSRCGGGSIRRKDIPRHIYMLDE